MSTNAIEVYQANTKAVSCTVTGLESLNGYTGTLTVKKKATDTEAKISVEGVISDNTITFTISASSNDKTPGNYIYDITITDGTNTYTLVQDKYIIIDSVKY